MSEGYAGFREMMAEKCAGDLMIGLQLTERWLINCGELYMAALVAEACDRIKMQNTEIADAGAFRTSDVRGTADHEPGTTD